MNDFERVKEQFDIVEYVRGFMYLKKSGKELIGLCPIHGENTPSFTVDPDKQMFYCHGCGEGGDIIKLFQLVENIGSAYEALEQLAEKKDIPLSGVTDEGYQRRKEFQRKQQAIIEKANENVKQKEAVEYLLGRGINQESVTKFRIGYGEKNHSIIIPLIDHRGLAVGYCERFIGEPPEGFKSKYRLPAESHNELFKKSEFLFNEHESRKALKKEQYLLVFEGQFDAISADQIGFPSAVAYMQSSLAKEQAKRVADLAETNTVIVLVPDRNGSGTDSISNNYHLLKSINPRCVIKFLLLPKEYINGKEMDFNDFVRRGMSREEAEALITFAEIGLLEVMMKNTKDITLQQQYAVDIVSEVSNPYIKEQIAIFLSKTWGIELNKVQAILSVKPQTSLYEKYRTIDDMYDSFMNRVLQSDKNNLKTGFGPLDKILNSGMGVPVGWVMVFLARSSVGKTAFALNVIHNATHHHKVGSNFFSFEQQDSDIYPKLVAINENMTQRQVFADYGDFRDGEHHERLRKAYSESLMVFEHQRLTIEEMEDLIKLADQRFFDQYPCKIVLIDYLGYIKTQGARRYEEISQLTAEIKQVAKRTGKLIILLVQTSRGEGKADGSKPVSFSDARDSGTIEENADILLGAYRPDLSNELESSELIKVLDDYHIQVLKNRGGSVGHDMIFKFDKPQQIIREWKENEKKDFMLRKYNECREIGTEEERLTHLRNS